MRPNLDPLISAELPKPLVRPALLLQIALNSGTEYLWSGVGDLAWDGHTWKGLGVFASMGPITENSEVQAEGTTVTLSGIGVSDVPFPPLGVTPPSPPRATVPGESMAWSIALLSSGYVLNGPGGPLIGTTNSTTSTASIAMWAGDPMGQNAYGVEWKNYQMPLEIPVGAMITGVYPVMTCSCASAGSAGVVGGGTLFINSASGTLYGLNLGTLAGQYLYAQLYNTVPGPASLALTVSFIGFAVYYMGAPLSGPRLLHEALMDIRLGAPAKIWFAMLDGSPALIGTPYRIFSGTVDKPNVKISPDGSSITLALENRLVNLQRANNRKYTAADQHLAHPDDTFFNFVELLQEMSLKEGS
jgi:hypothetical protein